MKRDLTPQPPSLRGKGEKEIYCPLRQSNWKRDLTPQPPSLQGKGEKEIYCPLRQSKNFLILPLLLGEGRGEVRLVFRHN
ncbi:hypothetical protein Oscil6304_5895 [Oscillatoria acuminata PCC 6304]|uniref:Uncharacterized protein n=1 Tax=Oscillatoria acuminata PCC 6304 TaxID=56110 RepID=K9TTP2_9CYAN|nr:hypothetical protein Oscil6304_5895 [Oscillatoria acuminata PCC 6304]